MSSSLTAASLTKEFINSRDYIDVTGEQQWLRSVFSCVLKVAKSNSSFVIDDIWDEMEALAERGRLGKTRLDRRILGVMLRFLSSMAVIESSGYFVKSTRPGSRPVTVWTSLVYQPRRVAA